MSDSGYLHRYFLNNGDKRLHKWLHYFDVYERHFSRFRNRPITMLEIGVHGGGSLRMWKDYFHADSTIVGIDINPKCAEHAADGIDVHIGSQNDPEFLEKIATQYGGFDIVLDDGSHVNEHVITSFDALYKHTAKDGVYFVEDMHTSYWHKWGGGFRKKGTFIEYAKDKIDELNATHVRRGIKPNDFTRSTHGMSFYDSIVVFEKHPQGLRQSWKTLPMPVSEEEPSPQDG